MRQAPSPGLKLYRLGQARVAGNKITAAGLRGIHASYCGATQVQGNEIRSCGQGGINAHDGGPYEIVNNIVVGNRALTAQGADTGSQGSAPPIEGGGIRVASAVRGQIRGNEVLDNEAEYGGGIYASGAVVENNTVRGNRAVNNGGGIRAHGPSCIGNLVERNSADHGGGIWADICDVDRNTVVGNEATIAGGGLFLPRGRAPEERPVTHNVIARNAAALGGGLACTDDPSWTTSGDCAVLLDGNTIVRNRAADGGGLYFGQDANGSDPYFSTVVRNCIVSHSQAGGGVSLGPWVRLSCWYTDVFGNVGGNYLGVPDPTGQNGNLSVNPRYADLAGEDYHLMSKAGRWSPTTRTWVKDTVTSPCIDAGDPASPFDEEPTPNGGRVNMGAYGNTREASKSPTTATAGSLTLTATVVPTAGGSAQIVVNLAGAANVQVTVLNLAGRVVSALPAQDLSAGTSTLLWNGCSVAGTLVPAGRYLVQVTARTADGRQAQALAAVSVER